MTLVGDTFHQLSDPTLTCRARDFTTTQIAAIAGIGNPDRFFTHLASLGISAETKRFPDHHEFTQSDITSIKYDVILMTEKDAAKCKHFNKFFKSFVFTQKSFYKISFGSYFLDIRGVNNCTRRAR